MTLRDKVIRSGNPAALSAFVLGDMENAVIAATPGGIEAQEARGQAALTRTFNQLPKEYTGGDRKFPVGLLKRLGFTIQAPVDDLFVGVTAPAGWQLRPTSHSMHSEIVDGKGRVRGTVFYKAAFYDRSAHFNLRTRYAVETDYEERAEGQKWENGRQRIVCRDRATDEIIFSREWVRNGDAISRSESKEWDIAVAHLNEAVPGWDDIERYW